MSQSQVFVSYASADRSRVLPVVDRINQLGVRIWIDRNQIAGGEDYTQEIPRAIQRSSGVVVFLSSSAFASRNVKKELNLAWKRKKPLIPLALETIEVPEDFEWNLEATQQISVFDEDEEVWMPEIRTALERWDIDFGESESRQPDTPSSEPSDSSLAASVWVPYLVDRIQQERELRTVMAGHFKQKSRRPLFFLVYGQAEQAIHEYLERLEKISLPKNLRWLDYADNVKWLDFPWLRSSSWEDNPEQTLQQLQQDIEQKLDLRPGTWPDGLVRAAAELRSTLVFCYRLRWRDWREPHLDTLRLWAQDWALVPDLPAKSPVVIMFVTEYAPVKKSVLQRVFSKSETEHPVRAHLNKLRGSSDSALTMSLLTELGNVTLNDVDDWILNHVKPADPARMIRMAHELLDDPALVEPAGVPMSHLSSDLVELLKKAVGTQ